MIFSKPEGRQYSEIDTWKWFIIENLQKLLKNIFVYFSIWQGFKYMSVLIHKLFYPGFM